MIDYAPTLVTELETLKLNVYAEHFLTADTPVPCISYMINDDQQYLTGDTFGYSNLYYSVKIWAKTVAELEDYGVQIDKLMRSLGFVRIGTTTLWVGTIGQKQLRYRALASETFLGG